MNPLSKALASSHLLFLNDEDLLAMDLLKHPASVVSLYFYWLEELLNTMKWIARKLAFLYV